MNPFPEYTRFYVSQFLWSFVNEQTIGGKSLIGDESRRLILLCSFWRWIFEKSHNEFSNYEDEIEPKLPDKTRLKIEYRNYEPRTNI